MMKSKELALCGLLTALAVTLMVLSGVLGIGTFAGPALAMLVLLPVLEEYGAKAAITGYAASALLGLLLVPELELAMVYAAFGWYPVLRPTLNRISVRPVRVGVKIALCTAVILLLYGVLLRAFGMTADLLEATWLFNLLLLILGVFTVLMVDLVLERMTFLWRNKLRKRFFR